MNEILLKLSYYIHVNNCHDKNMIIKLKLLLFFFIESNINITHLPFKSLIIIWNVSACIIIMNNIHKQILHIYILKYLQPVLYMNNIYHRCKQQVLCLSMHSTSTKPVVCDNVRYKFICFYCWNVCVLVFMCKLHVLY